MNGLLPGTLLIAAALLAGCSSPEKIEINAQRSSTRDGLQSVAIYRKDDSAAMQNAARGTLPFFYGGAKGLNVLGIKWNNPVTSENPGADCDLTYGEGKSTSHFFRCIVKEENAHVIVTLQEDLIEGRRMLRRVFVDGKGEPLITQWVLALERMGYQKSSAKAPGAKSRYVLRANGNLADIFWVQSTNSVTLRLSPKL